MKSSREEHWRDAHLLLGELVEFALPLRLFGAPLLLLSLGRGLACLLLGSSLGGGGGVALSLSLLLGIACALRGGGGGSGGGTLGLARVGREWSNNGRRQRGDAQERTQG